MSKNIQISTSAILNHLKLSLQFPMLVREIIRHQIIRDAAMTEGLKITDFELQHAADNFRIQHNLNDPEVTWRWLEQNCLTGDDFERLIYESLIPPKLIQRLFSDRVEPYFYENQLNYTQAVLYEIVFDDFDTAIELFYALEEKEISFIDIARQYIQEPELRRRYGYKGILSRTDLNSAISSAVFAANPPQILKPIVVGKKAHLILVEEIIEPQLDESLRSHILRELFSAWLEKQLQQYSVEITALTEPKIPTKAEV